ncbi:MAG: N-acetylmuramoyl-L-alanine amidase [Syntrophomonas sp.]
MRRFIHISQSKGTFSRGHFPQGDIPPTAVCPRTLKGCVPAALQTLLLCIAMLFCLASPALADTGTINSSVVNIRSGPGTNFPIAGSAYQGTELSILESSNGWYKVQLGQLTGWLSSSLVDVKKQDIRITVKGDAANLRSGPGTNFDKLGQVVKGDTLTLLEVQNEWYKVKTADGKTAFVAAYLMNTPAAIPGAATANPAVTPAATGKSPVQTSSDANAPVVFLDNKQLIFDVPPIIENDRTLVPLRAIFEAMGATVNWDNASRTVTAQKDSTTVVLAIGSTSPTINGVVKKLDVPGKIVGDRTLAPLRFVGEAFQGTVDWNGTTRTINIASSSPSTNTTPATNGKKVIAVTANEDEVNLRSGPSLNDAVIDKAPRGERMSVLEEKDGWYQVSRGGTVAWVSGTVVTLAWQENEPPVVPVTATPTNQTPTVQNPVVQNPTTPNPATSDLNDVSSEAVRIISAKNEKGMHITIGSGSKMEISKEKTSTGIKYEIKNRHAEGNTYFTETLGDQLLEVRAQDQGDDTVVEFTIPSSIQFSTASEDEGKKETITIHNFILNLERKTFGTSGEKLILTTLFPLTYTNSQNGNRMQVELDQLLPGKAQSEYSYGSTLLNRVTFKNQGSKDAPRTLMEIETNTAAKFALGKSSENKVLNILFVDQNEVQQRSSTIVIDPGHGGSEPGSAGDFLKERTVNLDIALKVADLLRQRGMQVVLTRTDDSFVSLDDRSSMANLYNAKLFVSIHNNAPPTPDKRYTVQGTETHYYAPLDTPELFMQSPERCRLATCIQEQLVAKLQRPNRGVKTGSSSNFSVLRKTQMPSALAEVCFIANPEEEQLLMQDYFKSAAAEAIADGITNYCNGTGGTATTTQYSDVKI